MASEIASILGVNPNAVRQKKNFLIQYAADVLDSYRDTNPWIRQAVRATALYDAAQFAWIEDELEAIELMRDAADAFIASGSTYGLFLSLLFEMPDTSGRRLLDALGLLELLFAQNAVLNDDDKYTSIDSQFSMAIGEPVQQLYLIMAMALHESIGRRYSERIQNYLSSLSRHYAHPVGASGIPIGTYINLTQQLHYANRNRDFDFRDLRNHQFEEQYFQSIEVGNRSFELARQNEYLWSNAHANIEYIDFDQVGFATLIRELMPQQFELVMSQMRDSQYMDVIRITSRQLIIHRRNWRSNFER